MARAIKSDFPYLSTLAVGKCIIIVNFWMLVLADITTKFLRVPPLLALFASEMGLNFLTYWGCNSTTSLLWLCDSLLPFRCQDFHDANLLYQIVVYQGHYNFELVSFMMQYFVDLFIILIVIFLWETFFAKR